MKGVRCEFYALVVVLLLGSLAIPSVSALNVDIELTGTPEKPFIRTTISNTVDASGLNVEGIQILANVSAYFTGIVPPAEVATVKTSIHEIVKAGVRAAYAGAGVVRNFTLNLSFDKDSKVLTWSLEMEVEGIFPKSAADGYRADVRVRRFASVGEVVVQAVKSDGSKIPGKVYSINLAQTIGLNLSSFNVPLEQWTRKYDYSALGQTTFTLTLTKNISISTPHGTIVMDPESTITAPGYASGSGDEISSPTAIPEFPSSNMGLLLTVLLALTFLVLRTARMKKLMSASS